MKAKENLKGNTTPKNQNVSSSVKQTIKTSAVKNATKKVAEEPKKKASESSRQFKCVMWFNKEYPQFRGLLFSVHNNAVDEVKGSIALGLGRQAGASDLIFLSPYGPLLIEMKDDKGRQSPDQVKWQNKVWTQGYTYVICRGLESFKYAIKAWLDYKGTWTLKPANERFGIEWIVDKAIKDNER